MPKRALNVNECEIARAYKVKTNIIEPISFTVPRKVKEIWILSMMWKLIVSSSFFCISRTRSNQTFTHQLLAMSQRLLLMNGLPERTPIQRRLIYQLVILSKRSKNSSLAPKRKRQPRLLLPPLQRMKKMQVIKWPLYG